MKMYSDCSHNICSVILSTVRSSLCELRTESKDPVLACAGTSSGVLNYDNVGGADATGTTGIPYCTAGAISSSNSNPPTYPAKRL